MTASQHTQNYDLPIYAPDDVPQYLGTEDSWNSTMEKLDSAIAEAAQSGGGGGGGGTPINVVQTTGQSTEDVMSQKAVTDQLTGVSNQINSLNIPTVEQATGESETATMSQKAITEALASAGGGGYEGFLYKDKTGANPATTSEQTLLTLDVKPNHDYLVMTQISSAHAYVTTTYQIALKCGNQSVPEYNYISNYAAKASAAYYVRGTTVVSTKDASTITMTYEKDAGGDDSSGVAGWILAIDLGESKQ